MKCGKIARRQFQRIDTAPIFWCGDSPHREIHEAASMKRKAISKHRRSWLGAMSGLWSLTFITAIVLRSNAGEPPQVTDFSPYSGRIGTEVIINGEHLTGTTGVRFNGTAAT